LGSAQVITDYEGELYERIEYTPYGETWIEHKYPAYTNTEIPYRFTSKELDLETGFYYYGARYLDPRTSRWLSGDPALGDYLPSAPVDEEAKKRNGSLPGQGGVFNLVNLHVYHYAGNNPVKYTDPDGRAAGDEFDTMDEAAIDFAKTYNDDSIRTNREYGSSIYETDNGKYAYTVPKKSAFSWNVEPSVHPEKRTVGTVHSHGSDEMSGGNKDKYSEEDIALAQKDNIPSYLAMPSGVLQKYDPQKDEILDIGSDLPKQGTAKHGKVDPTVMGFFLDARNHREHNKNFPDQQKHFLFFY
jgi:RHS repeat-associated protein